MRLCGQAMPSMPENKQHWTKGGDFSAWRRNRLCSHPRIWARLLCRPVPMLDHCSANRTGSVAAGSRWRSAGPLPATRCAAKSKKWRLCAPMG